MRLCQNKWGADQAAHALYKAAQNGRVGCVKVCLSEWGARLDQQHYWQLENAFKESRSEIRRLLQLLRTIQPSSNTGEQYTKQWIEKKKEARRLQQCLELIPDPDDVESDI